MRILLIGASLTIAVLGACEQREPPERVSSVDQITAAVQDSTMKQRWRDAAAKGQLPPLDSLPPAGRRVTTRTPAQVADTQRTPNRPTIRQSVVATVRPFSRTPVEQYTGPFTITSSTATSVTGTLTGRQEPLELHFKLPDTAQLAAIAPNAQHRLRLRDEVENQSLRREIVLSSTDRLPLLVYVSDGGSRPYTRRFEDVPLSITQRPPGRDSVSLVTVTLGGASATLRPGQRGQLAGGGVPIGIFVENSYWTPSDRVETAEGDAYHVTLMLYRLRTPGAPGG